MNADRLALLEQKFTVIQQEINSILTELQTVLTGITRSHSLAMQVINQRLNLLESPESSPVVPQVDPPGGKEL